MKALIFDLDGTLVDAFETIHASLVHTMQHFGLPPHDLATTKAMVGHGLEVLLEGVLGKDRLAEGVKVYRAHHTHIVEEATVLAGADRLIAYALQQGWGLALASNKPSYFSERILKRKGWAFHHILGPDRVSAAKPDPAMLHEALRLLGVTANDALYVGDMTVDLATARAAGVPVAMVATGNMTREALAAAGAEHIYANLDDLYTQLTATSLRSNRLGLSSERKLQ